MPSAVKSTEQSTLALVIRLSGGLYGLLPGVNFYLLPWCEWLAFSELQLVTDWPRESKVSLDYPRKLSSALGQLSADHPWETIHHNGDVETAAGKILNIISTQVGFAPGEEETIYWGCCVKGQRITFVYCRPGEIPVQFLFDKDL